MISFNDFNHKNEFKKDATSNRKVQHILSSLSLNDLKTYFRDGPFSSNLGNVNLHPPKGTHWVAYINENYFDSYGCGHQTIYLGLLKNKIDIVYNLCTKYNV